MELVGRKCVLRPLRAEDAASLAAHANNRNIWINVTDYFPHPYSLEDARNFIAIRLARENPVETFAITVGAEPVGIIGTRAGVDVHRRTAEAGYWLAEPYWGRGIVTEALALVTQYAFQHFELDRIEAHVFGWNPASARVLEKVGYTFEGRLRNACFKDGKVTDDLVYAVLR